MQQKYGLFRRRNRSPKIREKVIWQTSKLVGRTESWFTSFSPFNFQVLYVSKTFPSARWWFRSRQRGLMEGGKQKKETLAFILSAVSYLLWLRRSTETWANIKCDAINSTQTHTITPYCLHTHKLITLKAKSSHADGDSCAFVDAHVAAQTHSKHENISLTDADSCCARTLSGHSGWNDKHWIKNLCTDLCWVALVPPSPFIAPTESEIWRKNWMAL